MSIKALGAIVLLMTGASLRWVALMISQIELSDFSSLESTSGDTLMYLGMMPYGLALLFYGWSYFLQSEESIKSAALGGIFFMMILPVFFVLLFLPFENDPGYNRLFTSFWNIFPFIQILSSALLYWYLLKRFSVSRI